MATKPTTSRGQAASRAQPVAIAKAPASAPQGRKLVGNIGPGTLRPGAGKQVQRTGQPLYCGTMLGRAFAVTEHPNTRDPKRLSLRFAGEIIVTDYLGNVQRGAEWYMPATPGRAIKAALGLSQGQPIPFALEIWCEPDAEGRPASPLGYSYASYDRIPARDNDPLMALAYETGILDRPAGPALPAPEEPLPEDVDPETGEIRPSASEAA